MRAWLRSRVLDQYHSQVRANSCRLRRRRQASGCCLFLQMARPAWWSVCPKQGARIRSGVLLRHISCGFLCMVCCSLRLYARQSSVVRIEHGQSLHNQSLWCSVCCCGQHKRRHASYSHLFSAHGHANAAFFELFLVTLITGFATLSMSCIVQGAFVITRVPHCQ